MNQNWRIRIVLLFLLFSSTSLECLAQDAVKVYNPKEFRKQPIWIEMMNDPNANYFQTIEAFREFWKDRVMPEEPFEDHELDNFEREIGLEKEYKSAKKRKREHEREERRRERKGTQETMQYAAEVRAFKGWIQSVKPWVREDGSIVSEKEQQNIIDAQSQELKKLEELNSPKK